MGSVEWLEVSTVKRALLIGHKTRAKTKRRPRMPPKLG